MSRGHVQYADGVWMKILHHFQLKAGAFHHQKIGNAIQHDLGQRQTNVSAGDDRGSKWKIE